MILCRFPLFPVRFLRQRIMLMMKLQQKFLTFSHIMDILMRIPILSLWQRDSHNFLLKNQPSSIIPVKIGHISVRTSQRIFSNSLREIIAHIQKVSSLNSVQYLMEKNRSNEWVLFGDIHSKRYRIFLHIIQKLSLEYVEK